MGIFSKRSLALTLAAYGVGVLALPAVGSAHSILTSPVPRTGTLDGDNTGPCGDRARAGTVTDYTPGQVITVGWRDNFRHAAPNTFTINISMGGDAGFTALTPDIPAGPAPFPLDYTRQVTLPTTLTNDGTLQLRFDSGPMHVYYSCANIRIIAAPTPQPNPPAPPSPAPADTVAPKMAMPATASRKMKPTRTAGAITFPVVCDEACTMSAELRITGAAARKMGIPTTKKTALVGSVAASSLGANAKGTLRIKLTARLKAAMTKAGTFAATLTTKVKDAAGNEATSTTRITLTK